MLLVKPWSLGSLKMESCGKPGKSVVSIMKWNLANLLSPSCRGNKAGLCVLYSRSCFSTAPKYLFVTVRTRKLCFNVLFLFHSFLVITVYVESIILCIYNQVFFNTALCSAKILNNFYLSFKVYKHFDGKFFKI